MRKEVIFAVLIGTLFGVIIALGVKRLNTSVQISNNNSTTLDDAQEQDSEPGSIFLAVTEPEEKDVITETQITLSGLTKPNSWLVITTDQENYITKSNESGEFNQEVELEGGINNFIVTSFDSNGRSDKKELTLVHTTNL